MNAHDLLVRAKEIGAPLSELITRRGAAMRAGDRDAVRQISTGIAAIMSDLYDFLEPHMALRQPPSTEGAEHAGG